MTRGEADDTIIGEPADFAIPPEITFACRMVADPEVTAVAGRENVLAATGDVLMDAGEVAVAAFKTVAGKRADVTAVRAVGDVTVVGWLTIVRPCRLDGDTGDAVA